MSTATATATAATASLDSAPITPDTLRAILAAFRENPASEFARQEAFGCRPRVAEYVASLTPTQKAGGAIDRAREMTTLLRDAGILDYAATDAELETTQRIAARGWPGLLATMVMVPAWQWTDAPAFQDVPIWLWTDFAHYVFSAPQILTAPGDAERYAGHILRRCEELAKLVATNRGSSAVRSVLSVYQQRQKTSILSVSDGSLRRQLELHGRVLNAALGLARPEALEPRLCIGRKLKVGFLVKTFGDATTTTVLPYLEFLDSEKFEVVVFSAERHDNDLERYAIGRVARFEHLCGNTTLRLDALRGAELDVAVFTSDLDRLPVELSELAFHRFAPLQMLANADHTAGFTEIDLLLAGQELHAAGDEDSYTERLALIPGIGRAMSPDAPRRNGAVWTRLELSLPEDAVVVGASAECWQLTPEVQNAWARILARVPSVHLVIQAEQFETSTFAWKRFAADFTHVLTKHGLDRARFTIPLLDQPFADEGRHLYGLADAFLVPFPVASAASILDTVCRGVLVIARTGATLRSRVGAGILQNLDLAELVASDVDTYVETAAVLCTDSNVRLALRQKLQDKIARLPLVADPLAISDAFGALIEKAHADISNLGADAFRRDRTPLTVEPLLDVAAAVMPVVDHFNAGRQYEAADAASRILGAQPTLPIARQLMGATLLRSDRVERATAYLLAAIQHDEGNAGLWHDMAIALYRSRQTPQAIQALQTCVQIDPTIPERQELLRTWIAESIEAGANQLFAAR